MIPRRVRLFALILLCLKASATAHAEPCRSESFKGASYIICSFNPTRDDVRMYWRGDDEKPYRTFAALSADLEGKGKSLRFAMNGGMYHDDFSLYVEDGRELTPANSASLTAPQARYRTSTKSRTGFSTSARPTFIPRRPWLQELFSMEARPLGSMIGP